MLYDEPLGESPLFMLSLYTSFIINVEMQVNIYNKNILILHSKGFEPLTSSLLSLRSTTELWVRDAESGSSSLDHSDISARVF